MTHPRRTRLRGSLEFSRVVMARLAAPAGSCAAAYAICVCRLGPGLVMLSRQTGQGRTGSLGRLGTPAWKGGQCHLAGAMPWAEGKADALGLACPPTVCGRGNTYREWPMGVGKNKSCPPTATRAGIRGCSDCQAGSAVTEQVFEALYRLAAQPGARETTRRTDVTTAARRAPMAKTQGPDAVDHAPTQGGRHRKLTAEGTESLAIGRRLRQGGMTMLTLTPCQCDGQPDRGGAQRWATSSGRADGPTPARLLLCRLFGSGARDPASRTMGPDETGAPLGLEAPPCAAVLGVGHDGALAQLVAGLVPRRVYASQAVAVGPPSGGGCTSARA